MIASIPAVCAMMMVTQLFSDLVVCSSQPHVKCVGWLEYEMLFTPKPNVSAACLVPGVTPLILKKLAFWHDYRWIYSGFQFALCSYLTLIMPVLIVIRANLLQKRLKSYRNSLSWQNWQLTPSTKQVSRTRPSRKLVSHSKAVVIFNYSEWWPRYHLSVLLVAPAETFDWGKYICSNNTVGAPVSCFKHVSKTWVRWGFMISSS